MNKEGQVEKQRLHIFLSQQEIKAEGFWTLNMSPLGSDDPINIRGEDHLSMPVNPQSSGLSAGENPGLFPVFPMDDSFSIPVKSIEGGGVLPPDGGAIEFFIFAQVLSHKSSGSPECPEIFADFPVFRIIRIKTNFPLF